MGDRSHIMATTRKPVFYTAAITAEDVVGHILVKIKVDRLLPVATQPTDHQYLHLLRAPIGPVLRRVMGVAGVHRHLVK